MKGEEYSQHLPLISVAMCTYNGEKYVAQQLRSILEQTYRNIEVVIVDDCSSDRTLDILNSFKGQDDRITVIRNDQNVGFVENFQRALLACKGEFISLADQDDVWLPFKVETLHSEIGDDLLVYSRIEMIDENGGRIDGVFPRVSRIDGRCALSLIFDNCVTGHACLMHRDLLEMALPMPKKMFAHDQWLAIAAASVGKLKACPQVLSLYRKHGGNAILGAKGKRAAGKVEKNRQKIERYAALVGGMIESDFFSEHELNLLDELLCLLRMNDKKLYNFALADFLTINKQVFLLLYRNPKKAIRKICRGSWYFRLFPFF